MSDKKSLGDRMKVYEHVNQRSLSPRTPIVLRLDGKAFHSYTAGIADPFDSRLNTAMSYTMQKLCENIQGAVLGYSQSDEISILLKDWQSIDTDTWFGGKQNKMESVSASMCTAYFNESIMKEFPEHYTKKGMALFDCRAFTLPQHEVTNYFIWRQQDMERNSVQMLSRKHFSHNELFKKSVVNMHDMLHDIGVNWNDLETWKKRGKCWKSMKKAHPVDRLSSPIDDLITMDGLDLDIPVFTQDRKYIDQLL